MNPLAIGLGAAGLVLGLAADRLATRWLEHDEEHPAGRPVDWRTAVCAAFGAFAFGVLPVRFDGDPLAMVLFGTWFATLVIGMATDLDQRVLLDLLTLPVIPIALVYAVSGLNPLVGGELLPAFAVAALVPGALWLASIPFGAGAFGLGDVKLLAGVGLMLGAYRALVGLMAGLFAAGLVIALLLVARRISRKSYVPLGPFLLFGAVWGIVIAS